MKNCDSNNASDSDNRSAKGGDSDNRSAKGSDSDNRSAKGSLNGSVRSLSVSSVHNLTYDITEEIINHLQDLLLQPKNSKRIQQIMEYVVTYLLKHISPYLYVILSVLIIMFLMNCFQFYYYVKMFIDNSKQLNVN